MNKKQLVTLANNISEKFDNFSIHETLIITHPINHLLRGIYLENSSASDHFYIWYFCLPVFVPTKHISFNFGYRLKYAGSDRWCANMQNLLPELVSGVNLQAIPYLSKFNSVNEFIDTVQNSDEIKNLHQIRALAYASVIVGDYKAAHSFFDEIKEKANIKIDWHIELVTQVTNLFDKLTFIPEDALKQLMSWELETLVNLKLK